MLSRLNSVKNSLLFGYNRHTLQAARFQQHAYQPIVTTPYRSFWGSGRKPEPPLDFDPETDYYKVLGLKKDASDKDIKNMYYKLCYEYHPDRTGGMHQDKFKDINNAYQVLSDDKKKKQYDEMRKGDSKSKSNPGQDFYNANKSQKSYNPNDNAGQSKYKQKQSNFYSEYNNSSQSGGYQPPDMDPQKFRRDAEKAAENAKKQANRLFEQMRQKQAQAEEKYEKWQKEQQKTQETYKQQYYDKNKMGMNGASFKENINQFMKKAKDYRPPNEPDPFFTEFQRSSRQNPDKQYYKDLMKKLFLVTGGVIALRLAFGDHRSQGRTVAPHIENQYIEQQNKHAIISEQRFTPSQSQLPPPNQNQQNYLPHPSQQYAPPQHQQQLPQNRPYGGGYQPAPQYQQQQSPGQYQAYQPGQQRYQSQQPPAGQPGQLNPGQQLLQQSQHPGNYRPTPFIQEQPMHQQQPQRGQYRQPPPSMPSNYPTMGGDILGGGGGGPPSNYPTMGGEMRGGGLPFATGSSNQGSGYGSRGNYSGGAAPSYEPSGGSGVALR